MSLKFNYGKLQNKFRIFLREANLSNSLVAGRTAATEATVSEWRTAEGTWAVGTTAANLFEIVGLNMSQNETRKCFIYLNANKQKTIKLVAIRASATVAS